MRILRLWIAITVTTPLLACEGGSTIAPEAMLSASIARSASVDDLAVADSTATGLTLRWTQVDDGTGAPAFYRVKYAEPPIDWKTATIGCDRTIEGTAIGDDISCEIEGLGPATTYELLLMSYRVVDGTWRGAVYSNVATATTLPGTAAAPLEVDDLAVTRVTPTEISLSWTQVDDGTGSPAWYRVKYAQPPISWKTATIGCDRTIRGTEIGAPISCKIEGLAIGTTYDALLMSYRMVDGQWRDARYSNVVTVTTMGAGLPIVSVVDRLPLPPLAGHTEASPMSVNVHGVVVGTSDDVAVRWQDGTASVLTALEGAPRFLNDAGQIAGYDGTGRGVLWDHGTVTDIGTLPGYSQVKIAGLDNAGRIVGTAFGGTSPSRGFVWEDGAMRELPPVPGFEEGSSAEFSNGAGLILGVSYGLTFPIFNIWNLDGTIAWIGDAPNVPTPVPDGNEVWIGIDESSVAYIRNTDVGSLWRFEDGQVSPWPSTVASEANASMVSRGGLVLGGTIVPRNGTTPPISTFGIFQPDGQFYAFDEQDLHCGILSDEYAVCAYRSALDEWFVGRLSFHE